MRPSNWTGVLYEVVAREPRSPKIRGRLRDRGERAKRPDLVRTASIADDQQRLSEIKAALDSATGTLGNGPHNAAEPVSEIQERTLGRGGPPHAWSMAL